MSFRFALRWTLIGLASALALVATGLILRTIAPAAQPLPRQQVSVDDLLAAVNMPLDARGLGTQVISGTTLTLKLEPYPARVGVSSTLRLVAIAPDGKSTSAVAPTLMVSQLDQVGDREYAMLQQPDGSYSASDVFFNRTGQWRLRLDVNVGDQTLSNMLLQVDAR